MEHHPGEILRDEFMKPLCLSSRKLASLINVPAPRINDIALERRGITADTAIKLATYFNTTAKYCMNLQVSYELKNAEIAIKKNSA